MIARNTCSPSREIVAHHQRNAQSWTKNEIVAGDDAPFGCFKTTITIARNSQDVLWVEEPVNQTKPFCKDAKNEIRKFSIEDSPGWKKLHGGKS